MVVMAATTSFFRIWSPRHGFGCMTSHSKLGCKVETIDVCDTKTTCDLSSCMQLKRKSDQATSGVMDWSMFVAAITTNFLEREMMFHLKKKSQTTVLDVGLGRLVQDGLIYRQNVCIRSYETGPDGKTSIETLMNHMQDTALNHTKTVGLLGDALGSTPEMKKKNLVWVVTKMQLVVDRYPTCDDVVQIDTWRAVSGKNSGRTDWLFRDSQTGKILVRASSNWVMMNKETRRLSKYPDEVRAELEQYYLDTPPILEDDTKNDMELDKSVEYVRKGLLATWKDLDMNQHVNNVRYLGWILESVPNQVQENYELASMTLEYRRECRKDNVLQSQTFVLSNSNGEKVDHNHVDCQHLLQLEGECKGKIMKGRTRWRLKLAKEGESWDN
ncbi:Acyl-ACP thioesterase [Artemisia annua]|uniref:Acyl-[acyl-carrier-protein] hydrolase n=1 Tax=Artemisia annua TaxID=35608 RepID=A0A2U1PX51_ARTAN|nr:Acyl-ACP thioesterase [Artemisia annua]